VILNSEFRIPFPGKKKVGIVAFYDGGNVFNPGHVGRVSNLNWTNSVGLGFRYATLVGPIRVDVGRNLSPVPGLNPTQLFVSLGQAF